MEEKILQVDEDDAYSRLDVFLSSKCDKSRSYIIKAIKEVKQDALLTDFN